MKQEANRGLGDIPLRSTAALSPISRAQMDAATNLLDKALRALDDGDEDRARRFVERAVALPYDEHEETHPAAMMAHQQLFTPSPTPSSNGGDEWLDAASGTFASAPEQAQVQPARRAQGGARRTTSCPTREKRRLRRLTQGRPGAGRAARPRALARAAGGRRARGARGRHPVRRRATTRSSSSHTARTSERDARAQLHAGVSTTRRSRCTAR